MGPHTHIVWGHSTKLSRSGVGGCERNLENPEKISEKSQGNPISVIACGGFDRHIIVSFRHNQNRRVASMSMQDRIEALRTRHQEIETALDDATSHFDDDISVHELKKQKLAIKDEIAQLEAEL
jgi:hypothetical protein